MKYMFNFENREKPLHFNREKLLLSALQAPEQLYYMMDTHYEGIYQAEALERRRLYGRNSYKMLLEKSSYKFLSDRKFLIEKAISQLEEQKISVFRRGHHFYSEIDAADLVPGDVIFISAGDTIPSDIRVVFSKNLDVDQSIYTGNVQSIRKTENFGDRTIMHVNLMNLPNICYVGSRVVGGLARAVVVSTGKATYLSHLLLM